MKKRVDKILVVDTESTCWKIDPPVGMVSEIIEIGIAEFDVKTAAVISCPSIVVRPKFSKVSEFCTELTGWTQDELDHRGIWLHEATKELRRRYKSLDLPWASWGDYDRIQFVRTIDNYAVAGEVEVKPPFGRRHLNIKTLFAVCMGLAKECSVLVALKHLGLEFEGRQHNGRDDAVNIARILAVLLQRARLAVVMKI